MRMFRDCGSVSICVQTSDSQIKDERGYLSFHRCLRGATRMSDSNISRSRNEKMQTYNTGTIMSLRENLKQLDRERESILDSLIGVDITDINDDTVRKWMEVLAKREQYLSAIFAENETDEFNRNMMAMEHLLSDVLSLSRISISSELMFILHKAYKDISKYCKSTKIDLPASGHVPCCKCCLMVMNNSDTMDMEQQTISPQHQIITSQNISEPLNSTAMANGGGACEAPLVRGQEAAVLDEQEQWSVDSSSVASESGSGRRRTRQIAKEFLTVMLATRDERTKATAITNSIVECSGSSGSPTHSYHHAIDDSLDD